MLTQVIMLISFMGGLSEHTFANSLKQFEINSQSFSFRHHETIRIKESLDTQASSLRISWRNMLYYSEFRMTREFHYMNEAMGRQMS